MKNPLKKAARAIEVALMEPPTAKEIQGEVVRMQEELLAEAKAILETPDPDLERGKKLAFLGFHRAPEITKVREYEQARQAAAYHQTYALKYPGLKFVPGAAMSKVCTKYGLLMGDVALFTGKVPDWALERMTVNADAFKCWEHHASRTDPAMRELIRQFPGKIQENGWSEWIFFQTNDAEVAAIAGFVPAPLRLQIAAPRHEMHIDSRHIVQGNRIVLQDPIVFVDVPGGHIVLAAWGEEGSDPGIFNAQDN